jgi:hypothetical protein
MRAATAVVADALSARYVPAMRFVALAALLPIALASCATEVGDRAPSRLTSIDADKQVPYIEEREKVRLCIDVKSILGTRERTIAACAMAVMQFAPDRCEGAYNFCLTRSPVDDADHFSDCPQFVHDASSCTGLTVGELTDCILARGRRLVSLANGALPACGADADARATFFATLPECEAVAQKCPDIVDEPEL